MEFAASHIRSILFGPATRPDRIGTALMSGADAVCVDLEDSIVLPQKAEGRENLRKVLADAARPPVPILVRISSLRCRDGLLDLLELTAGPTRPAGILVPKCSADDEIGSIAALLTEAQVPTRILPIIETARGLESAHDIAAADPRVFAIAFGSADFAADIASDTGWDALIYARGRIVAAAASAGVPAFDGVWLDYRDEDGTGREARRVAAMGFAGKLAVHPAQVPSINAAFLPGAAAVDHAERIIAAAACSGAAVTALEGKIIDAPVLRSANRVVALARRGATITAEPTPGSTIDA